MTRNLLWWTRFELGPPEQLVSVTRKEDAANNYAWSRYTIGRLDVHTVSLYASIMRRLRFSEGFSLARIRLYVGLRQIFPYIFGAVRISSRGYES